MFNAKQIAKLKAEVQGKHASTKTSFKKLKLVYLGVPNKEHFPKLKNADGSTQKNADGHDMRGQTLDGYTTTFSEVGTSNKVMLLLPKSYNLEWFGLYEASGLGYQMRNANLLYIDESVNISHIKDEG